MRRYCINTLVPGCGLAPSAACHWNATAKVEHAHTHMLSHTHTHKHTYANKLPHSPQKKTNILVESATLYVTREGRSIHDYTCSVALLLNRSVAG